MRGYVEHLFGGGSDAFQAENRSIWSMKANTKTAIYYREYFETVAKRFPNFHYRVTLTDPSDQWQGERGSVQDHIRKIVEARSTLKPAATWTPIYAA